MTWVLYLSTSREGFGGEHAGIEWKSRAGSGEAQQ